MRGYNVQLEYKSKKARLLERVLNLVCCYNMEKESSHLNRRMLTFAKKKKANSRELDSQMHRYSNHWHLTTKKSKDKACVKDKTY